jgi:transposase, IS6 family
VDKHGQTIDFLLTARGDACAAKRFLRMALQWSWESTPAPHQGGQESGPTRPRSNPSKKRAPYAAGDGGRQCKYLNNTVEQDHRTVKKREWLAKGYGSLEDGLADVRRDRSREYDWSGESAMGGEGGCGR